ncbi:dUTP diphosphatase [Bacteriovorax stolpii]|uniref:Deoxyuridine 5'-triphosphate nucleotidohydrolase n=1 Tax=Bacteriovorax stolpii TaxID=960 RepID=A0A2K9NRN6_BACTC|nr:dUTP diphosphatase [Bacteriovorax stolpii]AUN98179.1 dUTP diphosphatase [Bacteriovorax stolpii]QDK41840.1 dUTP diphosphatase [Bacteriovorax stolpii]TDP52097.1 dUTP pyrophosphatase [Bacteriovorax stolpii]
MITVKVKKLEHYDSSFPLPSYETTGAAGADVRASLGNGEKLLIKPGERVLIPTGLSMEIPHGYEIQVRPRSGLSFKTGLMVLNSPGTIDSDYRGEVKIILGNLGKNDEVINHGDRVAQLVLAPVTQAAYIVSESELSDTARGTGGFGSTGRQ